MTKPLSDAELDALLAGVGPSDDDGFTARVMQALPPRREPRRIAILAGATCAGGFVAALATGKIAVAAVGAMAMGPAGWIAAGVLVAGVGGALAGTAVAVARAEA